VSVVRVPYAEETTADNARVVRLATERPKKGQPMNTVTALSFVGEGSDGSQHFVLETKRHKKHWVGHIHSPPFFATGTSAQSMNPSKTKREPQAASSSSSSPAPPQALSSCASPAFDPDAQEETTEPFFEEGDDSAAAKADAFRYEVRLHVQLMRRRAGAPLRVKRSGPGFSKQHKKSRQEKVKAEEAKKKTEADSLSTGRQDTPQTSSAPEKAGQKRKRVHSPVPAAVRIKKEEEDVRLMPPPPATTVVKRYKDRYMESFPRPFHMVYNEGSYVQFRSARFMIQGTVKGDAEKAGSYPSSRCHYKDPSLEEELSLPPPPSSPFLDPPVETQVQRCLTALQVLGDSNLPALFSDDAVFTERLSVSMGFLPRAVQELVLAGQRNAARFSQAVGQRYARSALGSFVVGGPSPVSAVPEEQERALLQAAQWFEHQGHTGLTKTVREVMAVSISSSSSDEGEDRLSSLPEASSSSGAGLFASSDPLTVPEDQEDLSWYTGLFGPPFQLESRPSSPEPSLWQTAENQEDSPKDDFRRMRESSVALVEGVLSNNPMMLEKVERQRQRMASLPPPPPGIRGRVPVEDIPAQSPAPFQ
jgi:hypothetical protein